MAKKKDVLGHDPLMALDEIVQEADSETARAQDSDQDIPEAVVERSDVFRFGPSLSIAEIEETRKQLISSIEIAQELSLDLQDTSYIDGAGLQLLIALERTLDAREMRYEWKGISEEIKDQMALYGLPGFFKV